MNGLPSQWPWAEKLHHTSRGQKFAMAREEENELNFHGPPFVQILDVPVPQVVDQPLDVVKLFERNEGIGNTKTEEDLQLAVKEHGLWMYQNEEEEEEEAKRLQGVRKPRQDEEMAWAPARLGKHTPTNLCQKCFNKHLQAKGEQPLTNVYWSEVVEKKAYRGRMWKMIGKEPYLRGMWEY